MSALEKCIPMSERRNYYAGLAADFSRPEAVPRDLAAALIRQSEAFIAKKEPTLPDIGPDYSLPEIERENRAWWPTHCEALRQGRGDLLTQNIATTSSTCARTSPTTV
jgi:hypothetical protein